MKLIIKILFFSSLITTPLQAQSILKGIVKSETGTAVPYASIQLLQPDSTFVQGTATDSTGNYKNDSTERRIFDVCQFNRLSYQDNSCN